MPIHATGSFEPHDPQWFWGTFSDEALEALAILTPSAQDELDRRRATQSVWDAPVTAAEPFTPGLVEQAIEASERHWDEYRQEGGDEPAAG